MRNCKICDFFHFHSAAEFRGLHCSSVVRVFVFVRGRVCVYICVSVFVLACLVLQAGEFMCLRETVALGGLSRCC